MYINDSHIHHIQRKNEESDTKLLDEAFTWNKFDNDMKSCNKQQFLYIVSLMIDEINYENNKLILNKHLILNHLYNIEMNGYIFMSIDQHVFENELKQISMNNSPSTSSPSDSISDDFYQKIIVFDPSSIDPSKTCIIPLQSSAPNNSSISLINYPKTMVCTMYCIQCI